MRCSRCDCLMSKTVDKKGNVTWDCSNPRCNQAKGLEDYLNKKVEDKNKKKGGWW